MRASSLSSFPVKRAARLLAGIAAIGISGCSQPEIDRPGTWQPVGANESNLRAMLVNPQDVYRGQAALTTRGDSAGRAVTRLLVDKRRPLLNASISTVAGAGSAAADTPAPASTAAGVAQ